MPNSKTSSNLTSLFLSEIQSFEKKHGKKLKEILAVKEPNAQDKALITEFFQNPIIHQYLSRKSDTLSFLSNRPRKFHLTPEELEIYRLMPNIFPFRCEADKDNFYLQGPSTGGSSIDFYTHLQKKYITNDFNVTSQMDIYQVRNLLNRRSYPLRSLHELEDDQLRPENKLRFILTPNWKDAHATALLHIINPNNSKPLASVFINSWLSDKYSEYISYRFSLKQHYNYHIEKDGFDDAAKKNNSEMIRVRDQKLKLYKDDLASIQQVLKAQFKAEISQEKRTYLDKKNKTAYVLNDQSRLQILRDDPSVDLIYEINVESNNSPSIIVHDNRSIPFIDASHNLQLADDDANCSLYGYNFLEAIARMLSDPVLADRVYHLAERIDQNDVKAREELQAIFKDQLKNYLPCYYNKNQAKPASEIKLYHLEQRWDLSSSILSSLYTAPSVGPKFKPDPIPVSPFKEEFLEGSTISRLNYTGKDKVIRYVADNMLSVLENEKNRLERKYTNKPDSRIKLLNKMIGNIKDELIDFEDTPQASTKDLKAKLDGVVTSKLASKALDKYQAWGDKLARVLLNMLFFLPLVTLPIKKLATGTWFFSLEGKSQEAAEASLHNLRAIPAVRA